MLPTSPYPKLTAILAALVTIITAIGTLADGNPATNPDWSTIGTSLFLCYGLFTARQNGVTSEQVIGPAAVAQAAQDTKKP